VVALVPAAGRGERLGAGLPKALVHARGVPLLVHAVRGLLAAGCIRRVVVAAPPPDVDTVVTVLADAGIDAAVVPGGLTRTESVRRALDAALVELPDARVVLVHDAARAFTPPDVVRAVVAEVTRGIPAVVPVLPVTDTIKQVDATGFVIDTPDRTALRIVQTPQGFDIDVLRRAHHTAEPAGATTDDAALVESLGVPVSTIPGHPHAMKITTAFDLAIAEAGWAPAEP
jgi:2-C-methyl-D-erythritol 4-phosphate cytidylyltransferase